MLKGWKLQWGGLRLILWEAGPWYPGEERGLRCGHGRVCMVWLALIRIRSRWHRQVIKTKREWSRLHEILPIEQTRSTTCCSGWTSLTVRTTRIRRSWEASGPRKPGGWPNEKWTSANRFTKLVQSELLFNWIRSASDLYWSAFSNTSISTTRKETSKTWWATSKTKSGGFPSTNWDTTVNSIKNERKTLQNLSKVERGTKNFKNLLRIMQAWISCHRSCSQLSSQSWSVPKREPSGTPLSSCWIGLIARMVLIRVRFEEHSSGKLLN